MIDYDQRIGAVLDEIRPSTTLLAGAAAGGLG